MSGLVASYSLQPWCAVAGRASKVANAVKAYRVIPGSWFTGSCSFLVRGSQPPLVVAAGLLGRPAGEARLRHRLHLGGEHRPARAALVGLVEELRRHRRGASLQRELLHDHAVLVRRPADRELVTHPHLLRRLRALAVHRYAPTLDRLHRKP